MYLQILSLENGINKNTGRSWGHIFVRGTTPDGKKVIKDFWCHGDVVAAAIKSGITEDTTVTISFELDEYLNPKISKIERVKAAAL